MNILNAVGRSDLFLKVDLSKIPIILATLLITIPMGVKAIVIGNVINSALSYIIDTRLPGKLYGYGILQQLRAMIPVFIATGVMAVAVALILHLFADYRLQLLLGLLTAPITYLSASYLLKIEELNEVTRIVRKIISRKN
jgi:riboflavin transporter FmnP